MPGWVDLNLLAFGVVPLVFWLATLANKVKGLCRDVAGYRAYLSPDKVTARAAERAGLAKDVERLIEEQRDHAKQHDRMWTKIDQMEGALKARGGGDD